MTPQIEIDPRFHTASVVCCRSSGSALRSFRVALGARSGRARETSEAVVPGSCGRQRELLFVRRLLPEPRVFR